MRSGTGMINFGTNGIGQYGDQDFSGFSLIDPVGGKYYKALRQGGIKGRVFGSGHQEDTHDTFYTAGVRHPLMIYFPPLPASTQQIDVLTPGTTGEMTGIPVMTGGGAQPALPKPSTSAPPAGQTFFYPVTPPGGKIWSQSGDLAEFGFLEKARTAACTHCYPAPPAGAMKINVKAGNRGTFRDVPIQQVSARGRSRRT